MTLDELKAKLPEPIGVWVDEYGPAFLQMTADEVKEFIEMLIRGDTSAAYQAVLDKMSSEGVVEEWIGIADDWATANKANAERIALQQQAAMTALSILLKIATALVLL